MWNWYFTKHKTTLSNTDWTQQVADELHKPITRKFTKRSVILNGIDDIWAGDLVEMQKFGKLNNGIKYLLMVIEIFSKFGWIKPLKENLRCSGQIKVLSLSVIISRTFLKVKVFNYITLRMKENQVLLKDGLKH